MKRTNPQRAAGWDRMIKRILGSQIGEQQRQAAAAAAAKVAYERELSALRSGPSTHAPAPAPARAVQRAAASSFPDTTSMLDKDETVDSQMRKLTREWIVAALSAPKSMLQVVVQFRHIVEGFWPFNDPNRMNMPHPEFMDIIAEELQNILLKCEAATQGYPCVAAQPHSMPHFCNYLLLLSRFIREFSSLPFDVPEFYFNLAFRACNVCLKSPLQYSMVRALVFMWQMIGRELESGLGDFPDLVDAVRDAIIYGSRMPAASTDPKELLVQVLELRARGWRPEPIPSECAGAVVGGGGEDAGGSALSNALARVSVRGDVAVGAAGDWAPQQLSLPPPSSRAHRPASPVSRRPRHLPF